MRRRADGVLVMGQLRPTTIASAEGQLWGTNERFGYRPTAAIIKGLIDESPAVANHCQSELTGPPSGSVRDVAGFESQSTYANSTTSSIWCRISVHISGAQMNLSV